MQTGTIFSIGQGMKPLLPKPVLPMYCKLRIYSDTPGAVIGEPDETGKQRYVTLSNHEAPHFGYVDQYARPYSAKFGIGTYWLDDLSTYTEAEVLPYIEKAEAAIKQREQDIEKSKQEQTEAMAKGREIIGIIPANAVAVILACHQVDKSDPMSDYYGFSTERRVILAFSSTDRNNFAEMRKAAANCPEADIKACSEAKEHRENYTGGHGLYLGESKYHGWIIEKRTIGKDPAWLYSIAGRENGYYANAKPSGADSPAFANPGTGITIVHNKAKNGVEIHFPGKPASSVLDEIKAAGFRWGKFSKCWYKTVSTSSIETASKYGQLPPSLSKEAIDNENERRSIQGMQEAQEQAMYERG